MLVAIAILHHKLFGILFSSFIYNRVINRVITGFEVSNMWNIMNLNEMLAIELWFLWIVIVDLFPNLFIYLFV